MWNDRGVEDSVSGIAGAIGARIVARRRVDGLSLSALAARAGIGKATLSEIEAGNRNPTLETLYSIAAALELPLVELIGRPDQGSAAPGELRGAAVSATLLESFDDPGVTTELYRLVIRPPRRQISPGHGPGVMEYLTVTAGVVLVGPCDAPVEVAAGGYTSWESAGEHCFQALSATDAEAVLVIRSPRRRPRSAPGVRGLMP
jgi:XRE family transcriptional regulator, regulator of sulfur utilization